MAIVKSSDIAELFDKIRDQRDAAIKRAEAAEAAEAEVIHQKALVDLWIDRAAQLEAERDEARRQLEQAHKQIAELTKKSRHVWLDDALNEGDGVYRP